MDKNLNIPLDYGSRASFRELEARVAPFLCRADSLYLWLFRDLGYAAETETLGALSLEQAQRFERAARDRLGAAEFPVLQTLEGCLLEKTDTGYFCKSFAALNRQLARNVISIQSAGGQAKTANKLRKRAVEQAQGHLAVLAAEEFLRPDGVVMEDEEKTKVLNLIKWFDNLLGRPDRLKSDFREGLVQDAWRIVTGHEEEEINRIAQSIVYLRTQPGVDLPRSAEQMFSEFGRWAEELKVEVV